MKPVPLCYTGSREPAPERRLLRAGPLDLVYENGDLRYVRLGGREVIRRWYAAVRDANWGTVPVRLSNEKFEVGSDRFRISYDAENREREIDFAWAGSIVGEADGSITFRMDGTARSSFKRNRIGFCLLHPIAECAGARCRYVLGDGTSGQGTFPRFIEPVNPFKELREFSHEVAPGAWAELRFQGDLFETEDQRNWTDASFKTFCTPLRIPFPVVVPAGSKVSQTVTLRLTGSTAKPVLSRPAELRLDVGHRPAGPRPDIGLSLSPKDGQPGLLRMLRPAHLRVDLDLQSPEVWDSLRRASAAARSLEVGLEAALTVSDRAEEELTELVNRLRDTRTEIRRWLVFHGGEWSTTARWIRSARRMLSGYGAQVPLFAGSRSNFCELNRGRPPADLVDGVCYSVHPQEHAFDEASLVETCAAQAETVRSARQFCGALPIAVTPITFRRRVNPYATAPGGVPSREDPRQKSLFGAGWTLGSAKYLAESGASILTFFETEGPLGVMQDGVAFPLFHVLADLAELDAPEVLPAVSTQPLRMDGLALRKGSQGVVLAANLTDETVRTGIVGLGARARVRVLDETNFEQAGRKPEEFRTKAGPEERTVDGRLELILCPYAYARVETHE